MPSSFDSFEQVQLALEQIVPFQTRLEQMRQLGFDPVEGRNVTLIPYPEVVARLAPHPGVPLEALDPGIRQCILAQAKCRAYLFRFERHTRRREGSFWLDFLNLRRTTYLEGWWFEALIVVSGEVVLFRNFAGQAHIHRVERQVNPLGPLQPAGEGIGSMLLR